LGGSRALRVNFFLCELEPAEHPVNEYYEPGDYPDDEAMKEAKHSG